MAKVILKTSTFYGKPYKEGDVAEVPDRVASRWVAGGLAEYAEPQEVTNPETKETETVTVNYDSYKAAELQQIAKDREIEGYDSMKKAELVDALKADDESRSADVNEDENEGE